MEFNLDLVLSVLNNKAASAYGLEQLTGVSRTTISEFRNGNIKLENMRLETLLKIHDWAKDNYKISYDYEEIIEDFMADLEEGLIGNKILVERSDRGLYRPIVDWYLEIDEVPQEVKVLELLNTEDVIQELKRMNDINGQE